MLDSTACLVGSNPAHAELALQLLSAGQPDVQEDNPISSHRKFEMSLVLAWLGFRCFLKHGGHARMRHVCFHGNARSRDRFRRWISQLELDCSRSDLRRIGRDCMLNRNGRRRIGWPGASSNEAPRNEKNGDAGDREKTSTDMGQPPHSRLFALLDRTPNSETHRQ
jgi:hypothetical protein